jgi:hypothetical protein
VCVCVGACLCVCSLVRWFVGSLVRWFVDGWLYCFVVLHVCMLICLLCCVWCVHVHAAVSVMDARNKETMCRCLLQLVRLSTAAEVDSFAAALCASCRLDRPGAATSSILAPKAVFFVTSVGDAPTSFPAVTVSRCLRRHGSSDSSDAQCCCCNAVRRSLYSA